MNYITSKKTRGCVFCRAAKGTKHILCRGKTAFVIMNIYPYSNGHLMVVPARHRPDLAALTAEERSEMMELTALCTKALRKAYSPLSIEAHTLSLDEIFAEVVLGSGEGAAAWTPIGEDAAILHEESDDSLEFAGSDPGEVEA